MTQARVIEMNLVGQIESALSVLRSIARQTAEKKDIGHRLAELSDAMPGVRTLLVLDKNGKTIAANRPELIGRDFSGRDYYSVPKKQADHEKLFVSPPFKSALGRYVINLSVVISDKAGGFNGVVGVSLDPDYFNTLLKSVIYADNMWSVIIHGDGLLFMMEPETKAPPGKNLAVEDSFYTRHTDSGRSESILTGNSYLAGEQRIAALRTFNPPRLKLSKPLIVAVSRNLDSVLAGWRRDTLIKGSAVVLLGAILVLGTLVMQRRQKKLDQQSQELLAEQITARQEQIRAIETQQYTALIQGILESTSSAVFSVDSLFNYTSFNLSHAVFMKEMYNCDIEIGANLLDFMPTDAASAAKANLQRALAGESFIAEVEFENATGQKQHFEISHNPISGDDRTITGSN